MARETKVSDAGLQSLCVGLRTAKSHRTFNGRRLLRVWSVLVVLPGALCGCGLMTGSAQLRQLQAENDRLVAEYRAQRDRIVQLQDEKSSLQARVSEAEKLLAQSGVNSPASRLSQVPTRTSTGAGGLPPYTPPGSATPQASESIPKWRPTSRTP